MAVQMDKKNCHLKRFEEKHPIEELSHQEYFVQRTKADELSEHYLNCREVLKLILYNSGSVINSVSTPNFS